MGTQSDEKPMNDIEVLVQESLKYTEIIHEYCTLASQQTLTEQQASRLEEILEKAQSDSWLDFLIDEADHILAHELGLIKEQVIQHQQSGLKKSLDRLWCEQVLQEIHQRNQSKKIQRYLQERGLYKGAIDGEIGPYTKTAIELLKKESPSDFERTDLWIRKLDQSAR